MDSYIVRIYRRSGEAGREVSGLVERVGNGGRKAFSNSEELWRFISGSSLGGKLSGGRLALKTRKSGDK
jgi:hypothetical protein